MKLSIIITKAPYGDMQAAEAVRYASDAAGGGVDVSVILVDGGVLLSKRGQVIGETAYANLGERLENIIAMSGTVFIDKPSLREFDLEPADLLDSVRVADAYTIAEYVKEADKTMIF